MSGKNLHTKESSVSHGLRETLLVVYGRTGVTSALSYL